VIGIASTTANGTRTAHTGGSGVVGADIKKAEEHLEVARLLGEAGMFTPAVFHLLTAAGDQWLATITNMQRYQLLTRDPAQAATIPYVSPKVDRNHQTKMALGIASAVNLRFWMKVLERREGGQGLTDKDAKEIQAVYRLFDEPTGLREASDYAGKRRSGGHLPPPPGEQHFRALLPFLRDRADFLRYDIGHPRSDEDRERMRLNAMRTVRRVQAARKKSGYYKALKKKA
jgi:hypothetical protein